MINVIASIKVQSSQFKSFIQEVDSAIVTVIEKWESFNMLKAHFTAPHMIQYKSQVESMVESVSLKILENV